jgi:hypothetical protein
MLWFFERNDESLTIETRFDNDSSEFVAIVRFPDGRELTERFQRADEFSAWLAGFEQTLTDERWNGRGGPILLPYGWPNKRLT